MCVSLCIICLCSRSYCFGVCHGEHEVGPLTGARAGTSRVSVWPRRVVMTLRLMHVSGLLREIFLT